MTTLTPQQKTMLDEIMKSPASFGAFSGMVFNAIWKAQTHDPITAGDIDCALKTALDVRLRLKWLSEQ